MTIAENSDIKLTANQHVDALYAISLKWANSVDRASLDDINHDIDLLAAGHMNIFADKNDEHQLEITSKWCEIIQDKYPKEFISDHLQEYRKAYTEAAFWLKLDGDLTVYVDDNFLFDLAWFRSITTIYGMKTNTTSYLKDGIWDKELLLRLAADEVDISLVRSMLGK